MYYTYKKVKEKERMKKFNFNYYNNLYQVIE